MEWQLQDAKARFSEVVQRAIEEGPQTVTRRGRPAVVIVSAAEFDRLRPPRRDLKTLLAACPADFEVPRREDPPREIDL